MTTLLDNIFFNNVFAERINYFNTKKKFTMKNLTIIIRLSLKSRL